MVYKTSRRVGGSTVARQWTAWCDDRWKSADAQQYQYNIPHDIAGVEIAREILTDLHFTEQEKELILSSIGHHRKGDSCSTLAALLYKADKQSRNCFLCSAASECYWSDDKKNMKIEY